MIFTETTSFNAVKTTCYDLVKLLDDSGGNIFCVQEDFIDPADKPYAVLPISTSWGWIQEQRPNKVLYRLSFIETTHKFK